MNCWLCKHSISVVTKTLLPSCPLGKAGFKLTHTSFPHIISSRTTKYRFPSNPFWSVWMSLSSGKFLPRMQHLWFQQCSCEHAHLFLASGLHHSWSTSFASVQLEPLNFLCGTIKKSCFTNHRVSSSNDSRNYSFRHCFTSWEKKKLLEQLVWLISLGGYIMLVPFFKELAFVFFFFLKFWINIILICW